MNVLSYYVHICVQVYKCMCLRVLYAGGLLCVSMATNSNKRESGYWEVSPHTMWHHPLTNYSSPPYHTPSPSEFRTGKSPILIATDVASRGLGKCLCATQPASQPHNASSLCQRIVYRQRTKSQRLYMCTLSLCFVLLMQAGLQLLVIVIEQWEAACSYSRGGCGSVRRMPYIFTPINACVGNVVVTLELGFQLEPI